MRETPAMVALPDGMTPRHLDTPFPTVALAGGTLSLAPFGAYIGLL
jgi:hypothetical protein